YAGADGSGTITLGQNSGGSGTINLNGGTIFASDITTGAGTGIISFNTGSFFSPNLSGAVAVHQNAGTTVLTGAASHTGGTTIAGGALQIGNGGTSGSLAGSVV